MSSGPFVVDARLGVERAERRLRHVPMYEPGSAARMYYLLETEKDLTNTLRDVRAAIDAEKEERHGS